MSHVSAISVAPLEPTLARPRQRESGSSRLGFTLFMLVNAALFVRPAELFASLEGWSIYEMLIVSCLAVSLPAVIQELSPRTLFRWPLSFCVAGLLAAVALSQLSHLQFRAAEESSVQFLKLLLYFVLFVVHVNTLARLRTFLIAFVLFTLAMTSLALLQYHHLIDLPQLSSLYERQENQIDEETGQAMILGRLCTLGIFNNPNDLSRMLVVCMLACLFLLGERQRGLLRFAWLGPLAILGYGNALTYSRGGFLGLLGGLAFLFYAKYGKWKTLIVGAVVFPALLILFAGRQTNINLDDGDTAHLRLLLWREGFAEMGRSPVFGTGADTYADLVGSVAHNSFVHAYTELGLLGGTLFLGLFYFALLPLYRSRKYDALVPSAELLRMRPCVMAILVSYGVGMLSSSRCYEVPTYTLAGLAAAYWRLVAAPVPAAIGRVSGIALARLSMASMLVLGGLYVFVRIKA